MQINGPAIAKAEGHLYFPLHNSTQATSSDFTRFSSVPVYTPLGILHSYPSLFPNCAVLFLLPTRYDLMTSSLEFISFYDFKLKPWPLAKYLHHHLLQKAPKESWVLELILFLL